MIQNHKNLLISKLFDIDILDVMLGNYKLNDSQNQLLDQKLELLQSGVPLDYVVGWVEVLGLKLKLNNAILIPREETEWWLPKVVQIILKSNFQTSSRTNLQPNYQNLITGVDLGTGSGLIGLYLVRELGVYLGQFHLLDIDQKVLDTSKINAEANLQTKIFERCNFILSDGLSALPKFSNNWFLVANLPYLPTTDIVKAKEFNVSFEPQLALYSGEDGLELYRQILVQLQSQRDILPFLTVWELDPRNIQVAKVLLEKIGYITEIWIDQNNQKRVLVGFKS